MGTQENKQLNILIFEDSEDDFSLMEKELQRLTFPTHIIHAEDEYGYKNALTTNDIDIVLSDYAIPGFNGMNALFYTMKYYPSMLFIFVTGTLNNEELAAQTILDGAGGFILKSNIYKLSKIVTDSWIKHISDASYNPLPQIPSSIPRIYQVKERLDEQIEANNLAIRKASEYLKNSKIPDVLVGTLINQLEESNHNLKEIEHELDNSKKKTDNPAS